MFQGGIEIWQGPMSVQEFVRTNATTFTSAKRGLSVCGSSHSTNLTFALSEGIGVVTCQI